MRSGQWSFKNHGYHNIVLNFTGCAVLFCNRFCASRTWFFYKAVDHRVSFFVRLRKAKGLEVPIWFVYCYQFVCLQLAFMTHWSLSLAVEEVKMPVACKNASLAFLQSHIYHSSPLLWDSCLSKNTTHPLPVLKLHSTQSVIQSTFIYMYLAYSTCTWCLPSK